MAQPITGNSFVNPFKPDDRTWLASPLLNQYGFDENMRDIRDTLEKTMAVNTPIFRNDIGRVFMDHLNAYLKRFGQVSKFSIDKKPEFGTIQLHTQFTMYNGVVLSHLYSISELEFYSEPNRTQVLGHVLKMLEQNLYAKCCECVHMQKGETTVEYNDYRSVEYHPEPKPEPELTLEEGLKECQKFIEGK